MSKPMLRSSLWSWLAYRKFLSNNNEPRLSGDGSISAKEVQRILGTKFPTVYVLDNKAYPAHIGAILSTGQHARVGVLPFVSELYDCDDYAFHLMGVCHADKELAGQAIFMAWVETPRGESHMMNVVITKTGMKLIEPQGIPHSSAVHDFSEGYRGVMAFG